MPKFIGFQCEDQYGDNTHVVLATDSIVSIRYWEERIEVVAIDCQLGEGYVVTDEDDMEKLRGFGADLLSL